MGAVYYCCIENERVRGEGFFRRKCKRYKSREKVGKELAIRRILKEERESE